MPQYRRTDRLNEQLRQEITLLIRGEVRDPRVALATITAVQTSPELDHAKVYFTTLGDAEERKEVQAGLRSAAAFMRRELGKRLRIRRVPELHFTVDKVEEEAQRIERLLYEALPRDVPAVDSEDGDDEVPSAEIDASTSTADLQSAEDEDDEPSPSASDARAADD
jgi:ribosome-binding factor A